VINTDELLMEAWGLIANASGGNWRLETEAWRRAAVRYRDKWHAHMDENKQLRRLKVDLATINASLIFVGDRFDDGGRYISLSIPFEESAGWTASDWDEAYRRLTDRWVRTHGSVTGA